MIKIINNNKNSYLTELFVKIIDHCYQNRVLCAACLSLCAVVLLILCRFWFVSTLCYFGSIDTGLITFYSVMLLVPFILYILVSFSLWGNVSPTLVSWSVIAIYEDCLRVLFVFLWKLSCLFCLYLPVVSVFPSFSAVFSVGLLILP